MLSWKCFAAVLLLSLALCTSDQSEHSRLLQSMEPTITKSRSSQVASQCTTTDRNQMFRKYWGQDQTPYIADFEGLFTLDVTVFDQFLQLNIMGVNSLLRANVLGYIIFIALGLAGAALLIVSAPIMYMLIFCPMQICVRKRLKYSKCEKTWPFVVLLFLGLAAIASCLVGLFSNFHLYNGYKETSCGGTIVFDDAINGNWNADKTSFFAGTRTIATELQKFNTNQGTIYGNLSKLASNQPYYANSINLLTKAMDSVSTIPNVNGGSLVLNYKTPFKSASPNGQIGSTLPSILGNKTATNSLVGTSYASLQSAHTTLAGMASGVDAFVATQPNHTAITNQIINDSNRTSDGLFQNLLMINDMTKTFPLPQLTKYAELALYGGICVLVTILLIAQCCFMLGKCMKCRHCIYILGFFIFFAALACFGIWVIFGFLTPVAYSGCNYFDASIKNPSSFQNSLNRLGVDTTVAKQFSVCLPGQNGDLISSVSSTQNGAYLSTLSSTMNSIDAFDAQAMSTSINKGYEPLKLQLAGYASSSILDVNDAGAISDLKYVSNPINYGTCSQGNFKSDSWIPHIRSTKIPCLAPLPQLLSDNSTCPNSFSFVGSSSGCKGCIGTYSILYNMNSSLQAFAYLNARYIDCSLFSTDLSNIWGNYYLIKRNTLTPVLARQGSARQAVTAVEQDLTTNVGPLVAGTKSGLYTSSASIVDSKLGLVGGLNCEVIGQDLEVFQSSVCHNTFSYMYFHRMMAMLIACLLGFLLCCNTCVIFRKKKDIYNSINYPSDDDNEDKEHREDEYKDRDDKSRNRKKQKKKANPMDDRIKKKKRHRQRQSDPQTDLRLRYNQYPY